MKRFVVKDGFAYDDFFFSTHSSNYAPAIYVYPEQETDMSVRLLLPENCRVTYSEPAYNGGWDVHVKPDGTIDDQFRFLYYEATIPDYELPSYGYTISSERLAPDLADILSLYGLNDEEIADMIAFWEPVLKDFPWYAFIPLKADDLIGLEVTPSAESMLRLWFQLVPLQAHVTLADPPNPGVFERTGLTVVEWGIVADEGMFNFHGMR